MELEQLIEKIWSEEGILVDQNGDGVMDGVSLYVDLKEDFFPINLIDFFARIGYETTAISYKFFEKNNQKYTLCFLESEKTFLKMTEDKILIYYKSLEELNQLLIKIASTHLIKNEKAIVANLPSLADFWSMNGFGHQKEASPSTRLSVGLYLDEQVLDVSLGKVLCQMMARASLYTTEFSLPIAERSEANIRIEMVKAAEQKIALIDENHLRISGNGRGLVRMIYNFSKSRHWSEGGRFGEWERKLKTSKRLDDVLLEKSWESESEVEKIAHVLSSYQHEVEDFTIFTSRSKLVRDELKEKWEKEFDCKIQSVSSSFKTAFHWIEEEILTLPHQGLDEIIIHVKEDQEGGLELPIRWLQEIYPVDLLIEKTWGMRKEKIHFTLSKDQDSTYVIGGVIDGVEQILGELTVPTMQIDYVEDGKYAYPSTSAVQMKLKDGRTKLIKIESDRYAFYQFYLKEILPQLKAKVNNYNEGQGHTRPFFDRIEIDVWMNEDERKLELDEERISSLEALHEDLYFNTLDYFAHWGEQVEGKPFYAPGGVYPFMHISKDDRPKAKVKAYRWDDRPIPEVKTIGLLANDLGDLQSAIVEVDEQLIDCPIEYHQLRQDSIHPELDTFLKQHHTYQRIVPDYSYKGLQIPVIECFLPIEEEFISPLKMTMQKKTIIIEAGHHSNEVSSTPAVLRLIESLSEDLLKEVNVVVIPMANLDGYQLLLRLMAEHPEWKHHAARYNAVGLEYSYVRFKDSVFGEANVLPNLLKRWAADVVVDDHGIPSHEWVQPFAGYNSPPRFPVSYFLPSAKMYGIGKLPIMNERELHEENFKAVFDVVNQIFTNTEIEKMNAYWRSRYKKYGNDWLPNVFLIELEESLNFYKMEVESNADSYQAIGRYPEWIAADIITEAADEIVYNESLRSCVEAQYKFNDALIEQLKQSKVTYMDQRRKLRKRPIQLVDTLK